MCPLNGLRFIAVAAALCGLSLGKKIMLMQGYEPEKVQGLWYVWLINTAVFDEDSCIKFDLHHDEATADLYAMISHWTTTEGIYKETRFYIINDRTEKARYFFESTTDKVALSIMGTDYVSWIVGFGHSEGRDTYFVATRTKTVPDEAKGPIEDILSKNEVNREWHVVTQENCPEQH